MPAPLFKRIQGRPVRGEGDVGRERLIEAARTILRAQAAPEISRKAVADAAGVTPALVSYYFPDKNSLMAAATGPLIGERTAQLLAILDSDDGRQDCLQRIVSLFVGLNDAESHLIDYSIEFCRCEAADPRQLSLLLRCYDRLRAFCLEGIAEGVWRTLDPDLFLFALWGMCKAVAQRGAKGEAPAAGAMDDPRVAAITDLALNGLMPR